MTDVDELAAIVSISGGDPPERTHWIKVALLRNHLSFEDNVNDATLRCCCDAARHRWVNCAVAVPCSCGEAEPPHRLGVVL